MLIKETTIKITETYDKKGVLESRTKDTVIKEYNKEEETKINIPYIPIKPFEFPGPGINPTIPDPLYYKPTITSCSSSNFVDTIKPFNLEDLDTIINILDKAIKEGE